MAGLALQDPQVEQTLPPRAAQRIDSRWCDQPAAVWPVPDHAGVLAVRAADAGRDAAVDRTGLGCLWVGPGVAADSAGAVVGPYWAQAGDQPRTAGVRRRRPGGGAFAQSAWHRDGPRAAGYGGGGGCRYGVSG